MLHIETDRRRKCAAALPLRRPVEPVVCTEMKLVARLGLDRPVLPLRLSNMRSQHWLARANRFNSKNHGRQAARDAEASDRSTSSLSRPTARWSTINRMRRQERRDCGQTKCTGSGSGS